MLCPLATARILGHTGPYYTVLYATLGMVFLLTGLVLGVEQRDIYNMSGQKTLATRGRGLPAFQSGNAILSIAALAAFCQGLTDLAPQATNWQGFWALAWTAASTMLAIALVPSSSWRRLYSTVSVALLGRGP